MQRKHWAQYFLDLVAAAGLPTTAIHRSNGWLESATINTHRCFLKSMTWNRQRDLYFQGVDPAKLEDAGDLVLLCGGDGSALRDIFMIPWGAFFTAVAQAEPVNTYRDRTYLQYKFYVLDRGNGWELRFERSVRPTLPAAQWRYSPSAAVAVLRNKACVCMPGA